MITQVEFSFSLYLNHSIVFCEHFIIRKIILMLSSWVVISIIAVVRLELNQLKTEKIQGYILSLRLIFYVFFTNNSFLGFYIIFELSLIPIFILVIGWGYQPERMKARISLLFYTLTGSLPLLGFFIYIGSKFERYSLRIDVVQPLMSNFLSFAALTAFLIKTPLFIAHLWLPKAHVEAPVFGSILLAALLLKLGTFGVFIYLEFLNLSTSGILVFSIALVSTVLVRAICFRLLDIKIIVAYSSVAHIGIVLFLIYLSNSSRLQRAVLIMLSHGFRSAGLFFIAHIQYLRSHSRALLVNKIIIANLPRITLAWFLVICLNLAAPPTINLLAELLIIINIALQLKIFRILLVLGVILSSVYSLVIYSSITQTRARISFRTPRFSESELLNIRFYLIPGWLLTLVAFIFI